MGNSQIKKKKPNLKLVQEQIINKPLKVLKKLDINSFKKLTSFSLNRTFDKFKQKIKEAEEDKIKLLKKEKIQEEKKKK